MSTILLIACGVLLAVFFWALQARWFCRLERGLLAAVVSAVAGLALLGAALTGILSYSAGKQIVLRQVGAGVKDAALIVQANIGQMIKHEVGHVHDYADIVARDYTQDLTDKPASARRPAQRTKVQRDLDHVVQLNPEILQINFYGSDRKQLATSTSATFDPKNASDMADSGAMVSASRGSDYEWEDTNASNEPAATAYVLIIGVPIRAQLVDVKSALTRNSPQAGPQPALTVRYNLQAGLSGLVQAKLNEDGDVSIASSTGRLLADVDSMHVNRSVPNLDEFRAFQKGSALVNDAAPGRGRDWWAGSFLRALGGAHK